MKRRGRFPEIRLDPKLAFLGMMAFLCPGIGGAVLQENRPVSSSEIKAAYLFHFARYVEWPPSVFGDAAAPYRIGVLGEDPFGDTLDRLLKGKQVNQRPFEIRRSGKVEDLKTCHILFISTSEKDRLREILGSISPLPVLTVSDMEGFAKSGGIVRFYSQESTVRIEINTDGIAKARLKASAKLLQIARLVRQEGSP